MNDHLIIDSGNGFNNAVLLSNGKTKSLNFPSFRAKVTGESVQLPGGLNVVDFTWDEWNGTRFVVGDMAMILNAGDIEVHHGKTRIGNEFQHFMAAHAGAMLGIKDGIVDLTIFVPPGQFNEYKQHIIDMYEGKPVEITLKGDKRPRCWKWGKVTVRPEGATAVACLLLDSDGQPQDADLVKGRLLVLDGGMHTFDVVEVVNGALNVNGFDTASYENAGLYYHIHRHLLQTYKKRHSYLTIGHIDAAIRNGIGGGGYILDPENLGINIEENVQALAYNYANWLTNNILDTNYGRLEPYRRVLLVGGIDNIAGSVLRGIFNNDKSMKIIDPKKVPQLKKLDAVNMNVEAAKRIVLAQQQKAGK